LMYSYMHLLLYFSLRDLPSFPTRRRNTSTSYLMSPFGWMGQDCLVIICLLLQLWCICLLLLMKNSRVTSSSLSFYQPVVSAGPSRTGIDPAAEVRPMFLPKPERSLGSVR